MSKLIPPLVSTTPPPIGIADVDDNEDDEFGDFAAADDTIYGCDSFSIPNTPEDSPKITPDLLNPTIPAHQGPAIILEEEKSKDYQDKRKNVISEDAEEIHTNGIEVPNVPMLSPSPSSLSNSLTNGHNCNESASTVTEEVSSASSSTGNGQKIDANLEDDDAERPPQLFDDDSEEKEEISGTPSNFSISFDDNVIDDDDEEDASENMPIELPNHLSEVEVDTFQPEHQTPNESVEKVAETCSNIQEFDDFDDEWKQAEDEDKFEDCEESINNQSGGDEDFGDFNAFASKEETVDNAPVSCDIQSNDVSVSVNNVQSDDFDDFQFTESHGVQTADDFNDFADFSSAPIEIPSEFQNAPASRSVSLSLEQDGGDDDDFGDFDDYTTSTSSSTTTQPTSNAVPLLNPDKVYEETQDIFKVMFEPVVHDASEYEYADATLRSAIFGQIKDVTDTHALSYQWAKSQVQQGLLKALNIDTRNILYAHGMPMPKFAANLGAAPLEPVKSDILLPTPAPPTQLTPPTPSTAGQSRQQNGDIPAAQFDWNASGLANPLDSSLSLPTSTTCAVGVDCNHASDITRSHIDEDWDSWLQSVSKEESIETKPTPRTSRTSDDIKFDDPNMLQKVVNYDTESVNSLQFPEMTDVEEKVDPGEVEVADDFSDFTSFQSKVPPTTIWPTSNMIPLRETYIDGVKSDWAKPSPQSSNHSRNSSYEKVGPPKEEVGWSNDTTLTPIAQGSRGREGEEDDFADFQDFQTSAPPVVPRPQPTPEVTKSEVINAFRGSLLSPTVLQPTLLEPVKLNSPQMEPQAILWPDPGITDEELARFDLYAKKDGNYPTSSVSLVSSSTSESSPNDPSSASVSKAPETKMSGPGGALMVEKHVVVPANKVILPFNEVLLPPNNQVVISKDLVLPILESSPRKYSPQQKPPPAAPLPAPTPAPDDDDWSDFISTTPGLAGSNTSPSKHSLCSTSTPELSLSIPQLRSMQSMQPSQPPIPVITPRGLVQTKIPTMAPSTPAKSLPQTALHVQPPVDGYQPAIISTQYAAHANQSSNQSPATFSDFLHLHNGQYQTTSIPSVPANGRPTRHPLQPESPRRKLNGLHEDDEWSDFMSSQPVNTGNHSLYTPTSSMQQLPLQVGNLASMASNHYGQAPTRADWNRNGYPYPYPYPSELPNIITNPVHFQSYPTMNTPANVLNKKTLPTNGILLSKNNKKPQNLNVARLPDLDFVAPKTKTFHNSKK